MYKHQSLLSLLILTTMVLSACGTSAPTPDAMMQDTATPDAMMMKETATPDAMMAHDTPTADAMMMHETPTADAMMQDATPDAMMESPTWFNTALTDANNGNTFTINDFKGKVVLVETMAVWCSTCKMQQDQIKALHEKLGMSDDLVSVSLDIDANENIDTVKSYLGTTGFDWHYAVAPADVSREIASLYGDQFLNPPSAPMFIIDRNGTAHPLPFGVKSADDLMQSVNMYLKEGM
jgi:cytochrome oxidase Cu insertion factor (SCO1/SenC/PrrC family)